jgi:hypothetical protein
LVSWLIRSDLGLAFFVVRGLVIGYDHETLSTFPAPTEKGVWDEINYGLLTTAFDDYKKDK